MFPSWRICSMGLKPPSTSPSPKGWLLVRHEIKFLFETEDFPFQTEDFLEWKCSINQSNFPNFPRFLFFSDIRLLSERFPEISTDYLKEEKTTWNKSQKKKPSISPKRIKQRWAKRDKLSSLPIPPPPRIQRQSPIRQRAKAKEKSIFVKGTALQNCWAKSVHWSAGTPKKKAEKERRFQFCSLQKNVAGGKHFGQPSIAGLRFVFYFDVW